MAEKQAVMAGMMAANTDKRRESYRNLTNLLGEDEDSLDWSNYMGASDTGKVLKNLKADLTSQNEKEVLDALGVCMHLLASSSFLAGIDTSGQKSLYATLIKVLKTQRDKKIINIVLQSLARSRLTKEVYINDLDESFDVLREILQSKDLPPPVMYEALQVILVLFSACPEPSLKRGKSWFPVAFSNLFHTSVKVRKSALAVIGEVGETLDKMEDPSLRSNLMKTVLPDLKDKYCKDMVRMVLGGDISILQVWRETVGLLGTVLHSSRSLINCLLNVVEKAFKISDHEVRVESFNSWRTIMDNFALDKNSLTNQMKLKLLLAPFKINNAKTEDVCCAKLRVWWHLVRLLSDQRHLATSFDQAVVPLLYFCFVGSMPSERNKGGLSNRNLIMSGALSSPHRTFTSLHTTHAEVLAQILATDIDDHKYRYSLPVIKEQVMSSVLFMRHYPLLLKCFDEAIQTMKFSDERQKSLGTLIFSFLLAHIRGITSADVQKKEVVDVVKELFSTLSHIESLCQPGDSQSHFLFKFFNLLTVGNLALPKKVLNSHQYHIPTTSSGDAQDIMCGTLSNHLIAQLCRPALLHHAVSGNEFIKLWNTVLENSQPATGKLRLLQAAVQELSVSAIPFLCPDHPFVLYHLWNVLLKQTITHITKIEVGEGEEGEPDWSSVYSVLHFPVVHATEAFTCAPFDIHQQIMEAWVKLWNKFSLITLATPTMEPNSEVEHVASTLLSLCQEKTADVADVHIAFYVMTVEFLVQLTANFQYAKLGKPAELVSPSPTKAKKKLHPLHNLGSSLEVTTEVFDRACSMVSGRRMYVAEKLLQVTFTMLKGIQLAPMKYIWEFIIQIVKVITKCVRVNPAVVFDFKVEKKYINVLKSFSGLIMGYITHKEASESVLEDLNVLEPLLSVAFVSTNKKIKQEVQKLLENIFGCISDASLDLLPFLLKIKTKWGISAPQTASVEEVTNESMEDFIDATPREKRTAKSLSSLSSKVSSPRKATPVSSKVLSPKKATPVSTRKQKAEQFNKKELETRASATSTPPTRYSARMRKIELTMENSNSDTASDHSNTSSTPDRSSSGSSVKLPVLTRVIRTCRNAPSPQSKEARHSTSRQPSESEEKEQGKGATRQSTSSSDPIVISSTDSDKITKDNKSSEPKQQNNSLSHSEVDSEDADCSEILWKSEDVSVPLSRTQDKGNKREETMKQNASKENLEKRNEDLCAVLHDTSLEVQKLLNDRCFEDDIEESTTCEKTKHEQFSSLCKPFKTSEVTKETPESRRSNRKKRINFMAVNVSPSVVKDIKIAEQKPKVKITNDVKEPSQSIVVLSDSDENENGELPDLSKSVSEKKEKNLDKKQVMETTPHKVNAEEQVKGGITESSSSGVKRKRKLFNKEEIVETSTKKRKIEDITNSLSNSLEDSVTDIESSNSEGIVSKIMKETSKLLRKTRSFSGMTDTEKEEIKSKSAFSPKVTRSGRKIVPPKKDMPEPMTPPKKAKKKLHQEADPSQAEETVRTSSSSLENSDICFDEGIESPLTEEQCSLENEMEVDHSSGDKVEVPEDEPKKCGKVNNETKESNFDSDISVTIIESYDATTEKSSSSNSKVEEMENHKIPPSEAQKDSIDKSSNISDTVDCCVEDKESSCVLVEEKVMKENVEKSLEKTKSKSAEVIPEEEQQLQQTLEKGKGIGLSEDLSDGQKTSEESIPMECGQDLEGEVSYPAARPGTEILDDSVSPEGEDQHKDTGAPGQVSKEKTDELSFVKPDKLIEDRDTPLSVDELSEEEDEDNAGEEEEDKSLCEENVHDKSYSPTSPEPESEDEDDEEKEYISAGQEEKAEEYEKGEKEVETIVPDVDKMQQQASSDRVQESEKNVINQEQENLERTKSETDKDKSKLDVKEEARLSLSEEITKAVTDTKESKPEKMDTSTDEAEENQGDNALVKMKVTGDTNVTAAEDAMDVEDDSGVSVNVLEELPEAHNNKQSEQENTVVNETQSDVLEDAVRISRNVEDSKELEESCTTKDSDETHKLTESNVCDSVMSKEECQQITSNKKQLLSENNEIEEVVISENEPSDSLRKGNEVKITSEDVTDNVKKTVFSPKILRSSKAKVDADMTVFSPSRSVEAAVVDSNGTLDNINKVSSPSKAIVIDKIDPVTVKEIQVKQTVSSPSRTKAVSSPRKTAHMRMTNVPLDSEHDRETVTSPSKPIVATETASSAPDKTTNKSQQASSDTGRHELEKEAECKATTECMADTEAEVTSAAVMPCEALEEMAANTRQQEEELSPDKSSRSRLNLTVSTPERMKQRGALMHAGSRAALLVACAKKNIKNRGGGEGESSASILTEGGRSRSLGMSPVRRSVPGRPSPGHSPDGRRRSLLDRPWVKHSPSPGASPSSSILKRTLLSDGLDGDTPSPPPTKYRRVSFADPPVSDRVEIPPSPRTLKGIRAQKRLDMTRMASEVKDSDAQPVEKQVIQEADPEVVDLSPALHTCQDSVDQVAALLTSTSILPGLLSSLENMGVTTVGQLCKLSEWDINSLPIKPPKTTNLRRVLKEYEKTWLRELSSTNSTAADEVEVSLAKMFGELDDKENLRPNHQECAAPEVSKAETEVKESVVIAGRSPHADNIQEIMEMEDITPLYSSPEETEEETLKNLYRRASEDDLDSQKKLLDHLLQTLPSTDVAEAIAQCIKARMADVTPTT
ncbi:LOW QUALITY PROTEIN: telomere-associated protein RIF1-like [Portunus trituberculatus]|uniref:LOW QUALITY PROTEIN: telomere-associated protein RIF1-like n=1 Tax=Portunus trituberculatus TaxID=210409 RepID=UPI001E1CD987|nr:LOW QUALITY PROTEIN: telomere-associated protein RIF1-like [Portunus trituberculatus]